MDALSCDSNGVRVLQTEELANTGFSVLRRATIEYRRRDGSLQTFQRETYDRGNGAAILLYDPSRDCVLLVRQFRYPAYANPRPAVILGPVGARGWTIEVPAGLLADHAAAGRSAADAIRVEAEEEAGVVVARPVRVLDAYMSPGSVTERVACFVATYEAADRTSEGGGLAEEGEDIATLEPTLEQALLMVERGEIADAKTIMLLYWAALHRDRLRNWPGEPAAGSGEGSSRTVSKRLD